jgi:hypothetical protein
MTLFHIPIHLIASYFLLSVSAIIYGGFWIWAVYHAFTTPRANLGQRAFWAGSMFVNPASAIWYWYIWKRWAFWLLFTPILGAFISLPLIVRSVLSKADETVITKVLFALGNPQFVFTVSILISFSLIVRLVALLHLARNSDLTAMDRNDWVVALALPVFGFGAALAYCAKYKRLWALASLAWWVIIAFSLRFILQNIGAAVIVAGEERRELYRTNHTD